MFDGLNDLYIGIDLDVSRYRVYRVYKPFQLYSEYRRVEMHSRLSRKDLRCMER